MKLTAIKVFYKILNRKIVTYRRWKPFPNEAFMVDVQNRFFSVDHSKAAFGEAVQQKKSKIYTYWKKSVSKEGQEEVV